WPIEPWDLPCPPYAPEAGAYREAGWVARLSSGRSHLESGDANERGSTALLRDRGIARAESVKALLDDLDDRISTRTVSNALPAVLDPSKRVLADPRNANLVEALREAANQALSR